MNALPLGEVLVDLRRTLLERLDAEPRRAERVHLLRSACKRLRALLALRPDQRALRRAVRRIHRRLGPVRDLDIRASLRGRPCPSERSAKAARRSAEARAALEALPLADVPAVPYEVAWALHRAQLAAVTRAAARALRHPVGRRLHALRKRTKAWLHQVETFESLSAGTDAAALRAGLVVLERRLGRANDLRLPVWGRTRWRRARDKALRALRRVWPMLSPAEPAGWEVQGGVSSGE